MSDGAPMLTVVAPSTIRLIRPVKTLPAPSSTNRVTPCALIYVTLSRQRTVAVTWATRPDRIASGFVTASASTFETSGGLGGTNRDVLQRFLHRLSSRLHQRAMKRRRDRQKQRPFCAGELGEFHRALDRGGRARDDDLTAAVVIGRLADRASEIEVARRLCRDLHHCPELEAEDGRHRPFAYRDGLLHGLAAQAQETRRILKRERVSRAKRRIFAERMPGDIGRLPKLD